MLPSKLFWQVRAKSSLIFLFLLPMLVLIIGWVVGFPAGPTWESAGLAIEMLLEPRRDLLAAVGFTLLGVLGFMIFKYPKRSPWALFVSLPWTLLVQVVGTALAIRWSDPDLYWGHTFAGLAALPFALATGIASFIVAFRVAGKSPQTRAESESKRRP